jgi:hypothetical protein
MAVVGSTSGGVRSSSSPRIRFSLNHDTPRPGGDLEVVEASPRPRLEARAAGLRCSSVSNSPITDSAMALPKLSPTVPMEGQPRPRPAVRCRG